VLGIPTIFLMLGVISFCAAMVVAARLLYDDVSNYHFHLRVSCASPLACHARAVRCATTCCVSCVCGCVVFVPSLTPALGGASRPSSSSSVCSRGASAWCGCSYTSTRHSSCVPSAPPDTCT
jgi:hypothetical protein